MTAGFLTFMKKRHAIYLARAAGAPFPWTDDPVLRDNKFTNVYRELDATTRWMRTHITAPHSGAPPGLMLFNCAYFRYIGCADPIARGELPKFIFDFPDVRDSIKRSIRDALDGGRKVFTGAYKILKTNAPGYPKESYVVDDILGPLWDRCHLIADHRSTACLRGIFDALFKMPGMGGTGFMAYEIVSDLRWTSFYDRTPTDVRTWANAGPGAVRGLNRLAGLPVGQHMGQVRANDLMRRLLAEADDGAWPNDDAYPQLEMREIEHQLCEFDKYERVRLGEGKTRAKYRPPLQASAAYDEQGLAWMLGNDAEADDA